MSTLSPAAARHVWRNGLPRLRRRSSRRMYLISVTIQLSTPPSWSPKRSKSPWGFMRRGATAATHISRAEFGMHLNVAMEAGGVMVGDKVDITLDVEMTRKPD